MIIEETAIPNITHKNFDQSKTNLANSIIENVYPLFSEVYTIRTEEIDALKKENIKKKEVTANMRTNLENLARENAKQKKISTLLSRIEKLVNAGLIYDSSLKNETTILLKVITKLSDEKLDHHLKETLQIISKRFSR
jgi:hypothetical protein